MQHKTCLHSLNHSVFDLNYHIVLVVKYRRPIINYEIACSLNKIFDDLLKKWGCCLSEFGHEADHCHLLVKSHPTLNLSSLITNLKSVSARHIRAGFKTHVDRHFWKPYFWSRGYAVISAGGVSLNVIRQYILSQGQSG